MIDLGPHAAYIAGAYAGVAVLLLALIGWVVWDARRVRAKLAALEARGVRRRSAPGGAGSA
jgi:heme exporter protein D